MHIKSILFPVLLAVRASYADQDVDNIMSAMDDISNATNVLGQKFHNWSGQLLDYRYLFFADKANAVLVQIGKATITAQKSRKLNDTESLDIQDPAQRLVESTNTTMLYIIEAKEKLKNNSTPLTAPVRAIVEHSILVALRQQKQASTRLSIAMIDVFTGGWGKGDAKRTGAIIEGLFNDTIALYEGHRS